MELASLIPATLSFVRSSMDDKQLLVFYLEILDKFELALHSHETACQTPGRHSNEAKIQIETIKGDIKRIRFLTRVEKGGEIGMRHVFKFWTIKDTIGKRMDILRDNSLKLQSMLETNSHGLRPQSLTANGRLDSGYSSGSPMTESFSSSENGTCPETPGLLANVDPPQDPPEDIILVGIDVGMAYTGMFELYYLKR